MKTPAKASPLSAAFEYEVMDKDPAMAAICRAPRMPGRLSAMLDRVVGSLALATLCLLILACGNTSEDSVDSSVGGEAAAPPSESASPAAIPTNIEVCNLLTDAQVATVLPGHDGGLEAASGAQLFGDETRSYKCSYDVEEAGTLLVFTIDLTVGPVGVTSYRSGREMAQAEGDIHREVEIADGGWVEIGDEWMGQGIPYVSVTALKNPTEISLLLMVPDAHEKVDAVVDLAAAIASALN